MTGEDQPDWIVVLVGSVASTGSDQVAATNGDESRALVTEAGGSFAFPGESAATLVDLEEAGEYVAVCFIPVGSTPDSGEEGGDGPLHFTMGMKTEFAVA